MATGYWCHEGRGEVFNVSLGEKSIETYQLGLFKTDVAVGVDTVLADLTEADFPGYARKNLADTDFTVAEGSGATKTEAEMDQPQSFYASSTPSQTVYGFFITTNSGSKLVAVGKFTVPAALTVAGHGVYIASITLKM